VREQSIQRAVVIFPGALGDLLLALPALRALRARHVSVTLVVNAWLCALGGLAGVADETVALDGAAAAGLFAATRCCPGSRGPGRVQLLCAGDDAPARGLWPPKRACLPGRRGSAGARGCRLRTRRRAGRCARRRRGARAALTARRRSSLDFMAPSPLHPGAGSRAKRWDVAACAGAQLRRAGAAPAAIVGRR
jgi:hypothetical protein